jgi:AcrR family transcriptional regulator
MTIYTHFASKDGLICAILHDIQTALLGNLRSHTVQSTLPPIEQLEAAFNILCHGMNDAEVKAGLAVRALMEFAHPQHPVHQAALEMERAILSFLEPLCAAADIPAGKQAARQLLLLAKGCFVMSPTVGVRESRLLARALASHVLRPLAAALENPEIPQL